MTNKGLSPEVLCHHQLKKSRGSGSTPAAPTSLVSTTPPCSRSPATATGSRSPHATRHPARHRRRHGALVHESELARNDPHPEAPHLPISYDSGPPRSVIRFRMLHASSASALCPPGVRARRPVPMTRFVPEEGVLHESLPMVARRLLPLPSSDVLHPPDRPIASTRPRSAVGTHMPFWSVAPQPARHAHPRHRRRRSSRRRRPP